MKTNRILCLMLCITMILGCFGSLTASAVSISDGSIVTSPLDYSIVEQRVNQLRSNTAVTYQVVRHYVLNGFSGNLVYYYFQLSPYGYAIYDSINFVMQEANLTTRKSPYNFGNPNIINYYGGPSQHYYQNKGTGVLMDNRNHVVSATAKQQLAATENTIHREVRSQVNAYKSTAVLNNNIVAPSVQTIVPYAHFFTSLLGYNFTPNETGTCTLIAIEILLAYYNYAVDDRFITEIYENGYGTTSDFFNILTTCALESNNISSVSAMGLGEGKNTLNYYFDYAVLLDATALSTSASNALLQTLIQDRIYTYGLPLVAACYENGDAVTNPGHSVVIYGYGTDTTNGTTVYKCHNGHYDEDGIYCEVWYLATWVRSALYINH